MVAWKRICAIIAACVFELFREIHCIENLSLNIRKNIESNVNCIDAIAGIQRRFKPLPFNVTGNWASTRCEVRPGPQFLLRHYKFRKNGRFVINHHYYMDDSCSNPSHTITSHGALTLSSLMQSFRILGSTEVGHSQQEVKIRTYTKQSSRKIRDIWRTRCRFCSDFKSRKHNFPIFQSSSSCNCLDAIAFNLKELGMMRVIVEPDFQRANKSLTRLYVGNVMTESDSKKYYRSSTYQSPMNLIKMDENDCEVCRQVSLSTSKHPPKLHSLSHDIRSLNGNWVSVRCEVRPGKIFLTRELYFLHKDVWEGIYSYYKDPDCRIPTYKLRIIGNYTIEESFKAIAGTYRAIFDILQLYVTSQDQIVTALFNSYRKPTKQQIENFVEFDATTEKGLAAIGLYLPYREYEILRITFDQEQTVLLYTGRRPSSGDMPSTPHMRATSFQDELMLCHESKLGKLKIEGSKISRKVGYQTSRPALVSAETYRIDVTTERRKLLLLNSTKANVASIHHPLFLNYLLKLIVITWAYAYF